MVRKPKYDDAFHVEQRQRMRESRERRRELQKRQKEAETRLEEHILPGLYQVT